MKQNYDGQINTKYGYQSNFDSSAKYIESEDMREMNNHELFSMQQKKLKDQNKDIDEIIGYAKEGNEINKELKTELLVQNRKLDDIETDVIFNNSLKIFRLIKLIKV